MTTIRISNRTRSRLGLPAPFDLIEGRETKVFDTTVKAIEEARSALIDLSVKGHISFDTASGSLSQPELDTEFTTTHDLPVATTMGGDVTGEAGTNTVIKLQNQPVSATVPTEGDTLTFTSGSWQPTAVSASGYDYLPLDASTVAMWYFDGNLNDSSGNGHNLSASAGVIQYTPGPKLRKYVANWQPAALASTDAALRLAGDMTFEFVGRVVPATLSVLAVSGDAGTWNWAVEINKDNTPIVVVYFMDAGFTTHELLSTLAYPMSEVFHLAVTRTITSGNTTTTIYINGLQAGTATVNGAVPRAASTTFHALSWHDNGFTFYENNGQCEARQMHVCSRAMSQAELQARAVIVLPPGY